MYSPDTLDQERASWRTVVYFNVARSVKRILENLDSHGDAFDGDVHDSPAHDSVASKRTLEDILRQDAAEDPSPQSSRSYSSPVPPALTESQKQIATLRLRLSPLVAAESTLADRLSGGTRLSGSGRDSVYVRHGWQLMSAARNTSFPNRSRGSSGAVAASAMESGNSVNVSEVVEEVGRILDASKEDVKALWRSDVVQKMIKRRRLRLEEWAELYAFISRLGLIPCSDLTGGSFLSEIDRVAAGDYIPSTGGCCDSPFYDLSAHGLSIDDILHARIQTMGVAEHRFEVPLHGRTVTWHLYDVGGARGQRHTWVPYFDEANAIIFVAPISAFDQVRKE